MVGVRKAIESLYIGLCDVYEYKSELNPKTGRMGIKTEVLVHEHIPCRLSHKSSMPTIQKEGGEIKQSIKLFLAPEILIKPNSKIVVSQHGRTEAFINSSVSNVYTNHQEIELEIFTKWA